MVDTRRYTGSHWLKFKDIGPLEDMVVTISGSSIDDVVNEEDNTRETLVAIRFEEIDKQLGLNATNAESLFDLFDSWDTDDYVGHQITLYGDPNVTMKGKRTGGVRIRPTLPKAAKQRSKSNGGTSARRTAKRAPKRTARDDTRD